MALAVGLAVMASRFPRERDAVSGPGDAPVVFSVALVLFAGVRMAQKLASFRAGGQPDVEDGAVRGSGFWLAPACCAVYLILMPRAGFISSSALLVAGVLVSNGYRHVGRALAFGMVLSFVLYILFAHWMKVPLPNGWIG